MDSDVHEHPDTGNDRAIEPEKQFWVRSNIIKIILTTAISVFIIVAGKVYYDFNVPNHINESIGIVIARGDTSAKTAANLEQAGIIKSRFLFSLAARLLGVDKGLRAGEYLFSPHVTMSEVLSIVAKGRVHYRKITLSEGWTTFRMMEEIRNNENLSGEITVFAAEGEMLPETYSFSKGDERDGIIEQAKRAMAEVLDEAWAQNKDDILKNKKELLTLASIIEKETSVNEERADIASVFINRLRQGMRLQTDPTVIYAITEGEHNLGRALLKKDLAIDNPYNTYKVYGLPPGPICNPGKDAIWAAANPSGAKYIYFVASGKGGHLFSKNLEDHNNNVAEYRKNRQ